jgi:hypothetical protein
MPWHDVHMTLVGPVVLDIAQHFVERWNYIRGKKYSHDDRYPVLRFPHDVRFPPSPSYTWGLMETIGEIRKSSRKATRWNISLDTLTYTSSRRQVALSRPTSSCPTKVDSIHMAGSWGFSIHIPGAIWIFICIFLLGRVGKKGEFRVQTVRSVSDWSHGVLIEHSSKLLLILLTTR